jgi:hypothetical protein
MSLRASSNYRYEPSLGIIFFEMCASEQLVRCMVSECALRNRAMVDGGTEGDVADLFGLYRTEVEEIAAKQHNSGFKNPIVRALHLAPPPPLPGREAPVRCGQLTDDQRG